MISQLTIPGEVGMVSDGYHTFNELYAQRSLILLALAKEHYQIAWVSKFHHDDSSFPGWFILGMELPTGSITFHLNDKFWGLVMSLGIRQLERAPVWDGHTSFDVIGRLDCWLLTLKSK